MDQPFRPVEFCADGELGYERSRTRFVPGAGLTLDEPYRLAHLPLVAPDHPRVIRTSDEPAYNMGRHARIFSLVLPIPGETLRESQAYRALESELKASPFARKIAWSLLEKRREKLHATICGSLGIGDPPAIDRHQRRELSRLGPVSIELRGLFSGNVNLGRLYLPVYPERRDGDSVLRKIQRILRRREADIHLVGVFNLTDDLDAAEASALKGLIERWWNRPILRFEADRLWLLGATDDLVLDSGIVESIALA